MNTVIQHSKDARNTHASFWDYADQANVHLNVIQHNEYARNEYALRWILVRLNVHIWLHIAREARGFHASHWNCTCQVYVQTDVTGVRGRPGVYLVRLMLT